MSTYSSWISVATLVFAFTSSVRAQGDNEVHPLLPGMDVSPLPVDLSNCNNLLYRHDGKLVALGYNGDIYLLSDTDGDGAEDKVEVFWESRGRLQGQIGMDLAPVDSPHGNAVFVAAKGKIVMLADRDGDGKAEVMKTIAEGWPPARAGVDVTGLTLDPRDGSIWFGLGVRWYDNAYEIDESGQARNDLSSERGTILRITPDFESREKICTGIRWPIALRFNRQGDLFCTDQEGATWLPNGNPFDELLHIQPGRHYGFPPRHPKHLPAVIDEPSVFDYGPQHQSTCGMNFNEPVNKGPVFGPDWWVGDALIAAESRGKIYRTKLSKTDHGYVAHNETILRLGMLAIDVCPSPTGELRICTHSGPPDWGTGPKGPGKIWRVTYNRDKGPAQPVLTWRDSPDSVRVAFDRPLPNDWNPSGTTIHIGPNARAGDRFETMRPNYEVVKAQIALGRKKLAVLGSQVDDKRLEVRLKTTAHWASTWFDVELPDYALQTDASGLQAVWTGGDGETSSTWLPHVDFDVARDLTKPSPLHQTWWKTAARPGSITLKTKLDLSGMLRPAVQLGAQLDYEYAPETVTVTFSSTTSPFTLKAGENPPVTAKQGQTSFDASFTTKSSVDSPYLPVEIAMTHSQGSDPDLTVYWSTEEDRRHRAMPRRRFLMPWARKSRIQTQIASRPEIAEGSWARGKALFFDAKTQCSLCHTLSGRGIHVGPDLGNLPYRDHASVLRDIQDPNAAINPDYTSFDVELRSGQKLRATKRDADNGTVQLGIGPGAVLTVAASEIAAARPAAGSLMPTELIASLTKDEQRDLMTFLLTKAPLMRDYASMPRDGVDKPPPARSQAEIEAVLSGSPEPPLPTRPLKITLVAGPKDHGFGEHDYPRWQAVWTRLLSLAANVEISTAWQNPTGDQWENADVFVFFKRGEWTPSSTARLRAFLKRGGGAVFIHWACEAGDNAGELSEVIGLASDSKLTKYRHGLLDLSFSDTNHPVLRGFKSPMRLHDESYWALVGDTAFHTLATAIEQEKARPLFWTREIPGSEKTGRVFVSIPGHYSWTFDDPLFRILLLRGMAWTAREPVDRFNNVVDAGL